MKILSMMAECSDDVSWSNMHYFEQALGRITECKWAGRGHAEHISGEDLNDTVKRVMPDADWIIIHDRAHMRFEKAVKIPERRVCKVAYAMVDIHWTPAIVAKRLNEAGWDAILMQVPKTAVGSIPRTRENRALRFESTDPNYYLENLKAPIFHLAPSINPELFKPTKKQKTIDVSLLGAHIRKYYPLRHGIWLGLPKLAQQHGWEIVMRDTPPGRSLVSRKISVLKNQGHIVGQEYATTLALSKAFIFGTGIGKGPVKKFSEGMACQTCCFSDIPVTAKELHFIPDWNFVNINARNWKDKLTYYLKQDEKREEIAKRGYETVMKYHTNGIRAKQLVSFLEEHS